SFCSLAAYSGKGQSLRDRKPKDQGQPRMDRCLPSPPGPDSVPQSLVCKGTDSKTRSRSMGVSKQLSNDLKTETVPRHGLGEGHRKLSQRFQLSVSTVRNTVRKWKTTGTVQVKARSGRPRKIWNKQKRRMRRTVRVNPQTSTKDQDNDPAADGVTVYRSTIRRTLQKEMLYGRVMQRKPFLRPHHKQSRLSESPYYDEDLFSSLHHQISSFQAQGSVLICGDLNARAGSLPDFTSEQGNSPLVSWITDYLTGRPQYVRLKDCTSETVVSSTGAPQGTVLSPFLFTLYTSDFRDNSEMCHMQKFSDDTAIVACVRGGQEAEYRNLVEDFVACCHRNNLLPNTKEAKEMVVDFRRARPLTQPVFIEGVEVEMVRTYRYLGLHLDERLDWSANTDILYRKGRSRLYFLRRLGSFNICRKLLQMFYQTVVSSCLFYAVVCWGGSIKKRDQMRLDKLVRRAGSVVGVELDSVVKVAERRTLHKLLCIMDDDGHPLHTIIMDRRSKFSGRLLSQSCSTDRLRRSFVPRAIRLLNSSQRGRKRDEES
ncbi:hypothetical protein NFI96_008605, partial [Prochilodus magdalenae]